MNICCQPFSSDDFFPTSRRIFFHRLRNVFRHLGFKEKSESKRVLLIQIPKFENKKVFSVKVPPQYDITGHRRPKNRS